MTGSFTQRSFAGITAVIVALTLIGTVFADQASAHHLKNFRKQRHHVEKRARSMTGTPYRYGGSSPNGFDCSGFTRWVFDGHGGRLPHSSSSQFALPKYNDRYKRVWKRKKLEVGDLVFHDTGSGRVGHAGMYIGKGKFISSTSSGGVRVRSLYDSYWGPRWVGATRLPVTMRYKN